MSKESELLVTSEKYKEIFIKTCIAYGLLSDEAEAEYSTHLEEVYDDDYLDPENQAEECLSYYCD